MHLIIKYHYFLKKLRVIKIALRIGIKLKNTSFMVILWLFCVGHLTEPHCETRRVMTVKLELIFGVGITTCHKSGVVHFEKKKLP